ncbi:hypothetical protein JJB11_09690 [Ramlibacter ginsenosidimutans]|uniref:Uncharacterized protein n=1 Tax=Ramlibacter ginsenosidimutans TaxID=502333 RepID=A0A934WMP1_9BURK|nr:hypothetical protein [Ramlibacter ginsenosidimutans]MBK6006362.1 hypothetical protein [Ramlibacter ginsenosidimutans]
MAQQYTTPTYTADEQLDFCRDWDAAAIGSGREGLRAWLEKERPHLLRAYDADFLIAAVEATRPRAATQR